MSESLMISVRLYEGWYHGAGTIPSPARLFQAMIAGRGLSGPLPSECVEALQWLEQQPPPVVAAPVTITGQKVATYVPNNDLDSRQGDHRRIGEIRTKKAVQPLLFDVNVPFLYCWEFDDENRNDTAIEHLCELTDGVYQLGRTFDAAWATADLLNAEELSNRFRDHRGPINRPSTGKGSVECPTTGSLASLIRRYGDMSNRYALTADSKGQTFRRRAKPKWRMVSYKSIPLRVCFDLIDRKTNSLAPWPTHRTHELVTSIRDQAVEKLLKSLPDRSAEIKQTLIGRTAEGENAGPTSARVRMIPLPSIGHEKTNQDIRRILIEIPGNCPLRTDDLLWAFSGQSLELHSRAVDLVRSQQHRQLEHYGVSANASPVWQTVTPLALSNVSRRRIEPDRSKRQPSDLKGAGERRIEQELASSAVRHALRHAGIVEPVRRVRVQREPFDRQGTRAEPFAEGTRFSKHSLWHAELEFEQPVAGPLVIGDGRFLGLGLMRPVSSETGVFAFSVESGLSKKPGPQSLAYALRRAVMARAGDILGYNRVPTYFSGHRKGGAPARSEEQGHLAFLFDPVESLLLVLTPECIDRSRHRPHVKYLATLESALADFRELRAGRNGHLQLRPTEVDCYGHRLFTFSNVWESVLPYQVNRHARKSTAEATLTRDMLAECQRRGFPRPEVKVLDWNVQSGLGLAGRLRLTFQQAVKGPIVLGKTRHYGGGLFAAVDHGAD